MRGKKHTGRAVGARPFSRTAPPAAGDIPHSPEAEQAALGCLMLAGASGSVAEVDAILEQLSQRLLYLEAHQMILAAVVSLRQGKHGVDLVTVGQKLKEAGNLEAMGGLVYLSEAMDLTPSMLNFPTYLDTLQTMALRRWTLAKRERLNVLATAEGLTLDQIREEFDEISDTAHKIGKAKRKAVTVVKMSDQLKYQPNETLGLVGDGDITKGYQGVTVIAGPPGSGKSLVGDSLAVAGAIGRGHWMGRKIHRPFKTLIIQCENGASRLKKVCQAMKENYPDIDFDKSIRWTLPPEEGLPFHRPEFRREIGRLVEEFGPDVIILDPWTAVAAEDASKEIIDKLAEIRSMLPAGDACPALVIIAHTKKPRTEDKGSRGRALMYSVSGSQALVSTARCVYVLLPFTDDIQDKRVLWCCSKLSDSENPPADTLWYRRLGGMFQHCDDNPEDFWSEDRRENRDWLTPDMIRTVLKDGATMTASRLAQNLADQFNDGKGKSSVHKWLKKPKFADLLTETAGLLGLKR